MVWNIIILNHDVCSQEHTANKVDAFCLFFHTNCSPHVECAKLSGLPPGKKSNLCTHESKTWQPFMWKCPQLCLMFKHLLAHNLAESCCLAWLSTLDLENLETVAAVSQPGQFGLLSLGQTSRANIEYFQNWASKWQIHCHFSRHWVKSLSYFDSASTGNFLQ